ncbi:MAG: nucleotide sugar dehydrogenase, partial [Erysipelotrichaceae bacterium]|nr:nucleotide sugar dehydrogenase [Erysipelotrichaceae bacterium]
LGFRPGLVGGHCIGVDPYYFIYKSEQLGYHSQIISTARKINDDMGRFIVESTIKLLVEAKKAPAKAKVAILGLTFKENCPDCRNSKVADVIERFKEYTIDPIVVDPWAPKEEAKKIYGITLSELEDVKDMDCVVLAVAHDQFKEIGKEKISRLFSEERKPGVFIDVKGVFNRTDFEEDDLLYWRL